jgi:hypothetical protein
MRKSIEHSGLWLFTYISCQKDKVKDKYGTVKTKTELLTTGTWKYIGAIISPAYDCYGDGTTVTNIFRIMKDCEKDDFEITALRQPIPTLRFITSPLILGQWES